MKLTHDQVRRICSGAQAKCDNFTMRSAKQHIMIRVAGNEEAWRSFAMAFNANTKKELTNALVKIEEDAR